jgi:hypothetical protein
MNRTVKVALRWLVNAPNGASPRGQQFSRPARFDHQGEGWTGNAWSLVITAEGFPDVEGRQLATAKFLVSDAPNDWLSVGRRFILFEDVPLVEGVIPFRPIAVEKSRSHSLTRSER